MKQGLVDYIIYGILLCVSFFPAYLGYLEQYARIGYLTTIIFALCTYIPYIHTYHVRGASSLILVACFGLMIESIGVMTCFPYGCFIYSNQLGPKLGDIVPYLLIVTRPPLVIGIWSIVKNYVTYGYRRWTMGALALVVVDLVLDPLAVLMGLWSFDGGGFWWGVPLSNFGGWLFSGFIGVMIVDTIIGQQHKTTIQIRGMIYTLLFFVGYGIWRLILSM